MRLISEDLPEGVRELLKAETRGYVQDELVVDYDMWTACECGMRLVSTDSCLRLS